MEALRESAVKHQVADHVIFSGFQTNIPEILSACDLFIHPTLEDALPTVLLEAMASKKPIIACQVGGVPEIITNNINGILVPPSDPDSLSSATINLIARPEKIAQFKEKGFEIVNQKFFIGKQVENLTKLYLEVLDEKHSHST